MLFQSCFMKFQEFITDRMRKKPSYIFCCGMIELTKQKLLNDSVAENVFQLELLWM